MAANMHEMQHAPSDISREAAKRDGIARENVGFLRKHVRRKTHADIAHYAGGSESMVHRWFSTGVDTLGKGLAFIGLKVVPDDYCVVSRETYESYQILAEQHVMANREARQRERFIDNTAVELDD